MNTAAPSSPLPAGVVRLSEWGVIRAVGSDCRKFLHSQLTQDVESMAATDARLAGYCSAKGRLLASFVIWAHGADEIRLACSADLLQATLKRLSMFVMRARCKLSDASDELPLYGLAGDAAAALAGAPTAVWGRSDGDDGSDSGAMIRLPDARVDDATIPRYLACGASAPDLPVLALSSWDWLEARSGVARIVQATVEQFVPQMVNLEVVGGVNFQKGCYPGQEIVARSQYRGSVKRRSFVVTSASALAPGQEVFHSGDPDQPAGMVVLAGTHAGEHAALVELKLATLEAGTLHAQSAAGAALRRVALPYALPVDAG